ncbi:CopD family protein [Brucella sp. IR073]|uniref:CopD family protein n=1 Tax=unclassified Brucella TaxID=2632610 RepID=UPI003B97D2FD
MAFYPYLVAAHVTAVVFLVGGLFAHDRVMSMAARLPREQQAGILAVLLRLDRHAITPALLLTWAFGLSLAVWAQWFSSRWVMVKLVFVLALSALHGVQSGRLRRSIRDGKAAASLPGASIGIVLAMLIIAVLAVVKPGLH